ncbi:MAG TPA: type IV toxin-antitoxin system AbiEi family antitoxin domain-containing protein, partial [Solirubrobacteraceae bacterium]|nr:type IV toxin-antitoxin system AbiEi family antitoxin domain-containing protein [Solirubrobacteraceae bacterium]
MRPKFAIAAGLASAQHGRVARRQLMAAGIDSEQIKRWLADGRLRAVHRGVYALGHNAPSMHAAYLAAVLAGGDGARLSHAPAAHLFELTRAKRPPPPEITVPTLDHRRRPGIVIHRVARLHPHDATIRDGIPITSVPRVLLDLAPRLAPPDLARACHEAWVHHRTTPIHVDACIARNPHKPGIAKLRRALGADVRLSDLEDAFLILLRQHGLPLPRTNIDRHGDKVDCHWPQHGLTVELLSYRFHASRDGFEKDVARRRRSHHIAFTW